VKVHARTDLGGPYGNGTESVAVAEKTVPEDGRASVPLELEGGEKPPMNLYKNKEPYVGTIESVERIVGPNSPGETCHVVINHAGNMPYWEGQSYGIIPPGTKINSKGKEVPHGVRLYSIGSTRYGDGFDGFDGLFVGRDRIRLAPVGAGPGGREMRTGGFTGCSDRFLSRLGCSLIDPSDQSPSFWPR
jgi:hypothetical protein